MLTFIASDWTEGRETGTKGYMIAADYVVSLFKMWGIKPAGDMPGFGGGRGMGGGQRGGTPATPPERTYFQEFGLKSTSDVQSSMSLTTNKAGAIQTRDFTSGVDYQAMGGRGGGSGMDSMTAPVVFVGYGIQEPSIKFDELTGLNLKGKIVIVLTEAPGRDDPKSPFQAKKELKDKYFPAAPAGGQRGPGGAGQPARFNKITEIQKLGPAAVFQVANVNNDAATFRNMSRPAVSHINDDRPVINRQRGGSLSIPGVTGGGPMGGSRVPTLTITRDMANAILGVTGQTIDDLKPRSRKRSSPPPRTWPGPGSP